jgi:hypothetical protein
MPEAGEGAAGAVGGADRRASRGHTAIEPTGGDSKNAAVAGVYQAVAAAEEAACLGAFVIGDRWWKCMRSEQTASCCVCIMQGWVSLDNSRSVIVL